MIIIILDIDYSFVAMCRSLSTTRVLCAVITRPIKAFFERLAAEEGISYHFEDSKKNHFLVFSDQAKQTKNIAPSCPTTIDVE